MNKKPIHKTHTPSAIMFHLILAFVQRASFTKHIFVLIAISCVASSSYAHAAPEPPTVKLSIDAIIKDLSTEEASHGFQAARNYADTVIAGAGSKQGYHSKKPDEFFSFQGPYTFPTLAADEIGKYRFGLALFSDDGCQLKIQELPAPYKLLEYGTPQALPNTEESFEVFYEFFDPGQTVTMDVWYSNVKFIEGGSEVDIDGCTLFVVKRPYIDLAIAPIGDEPELLEDRNAGAATHEMNPGGVVLAPVTDGGNPVSAGKRTKITLRAGHKPVDGGKFRLSASEELTKIKIYTTKDGTVELPLPQEWDTVADFIAASHDYYIGSEAFSPNEAPQSGTLTLTYLAPNRTSFENPLISDQVKVTIQTGNHVVIRPAKGTDKTKLIIPIAENTIFPKIGQEIEVATYLSEDFEGQVVITNKNPEDIGLKKSKDGINDPLLDTFIIPIHLGKLVPTADTPESFFAKGIKETTTAMLEAKLVKSSDPNFSQTSNLNASVVEVGMREVAFDNRGTGYIPLTRDDGTLFPAVVDATKTPNLIKPQWMDTNNDGVFDVTLGETNDSVAYVKGSDPFIGCTVKINSADTHVAKIRAKCSDQMSLSEGRAWQKPEDSSLAVFAPKFTKGNLPQTIKFYGKSDPSGYPAFKIEWEINCNDGEWLPFATTKHQVYVTLDKPSTTITANRETVFYLACKPAQNETKALNIVTAINSEFRNKNISSIDPTNGNPDGILYDAYGASGRAPGTGSHITQTKTGECGGWARFLSEVIAVQGLIAPAQSICAKGVGYQPGGAVASTNVLAGQKFCNMFYAGKGTLTIASGAKMSPIPEGSGITVPCQGGTTGKFYWPAHEIVKFVDGAQTYYMDPTFGSSIYASLNLYNFSLAGFSDNNPTSPDRWYWTPDLTAVDITEF